MTLSSYPGYFQKSHWRSMVLLEIPRVTWQPWVICCRLLSPTHCNYCRLALSHHLYVNRLVQERRNSIANAMELCLSCTNPSMYSCITWCLYNSSEYDMEALVKPAGSRTLHMPGNTQMTSGGVECAIDWEVLQLPTEHRQQLYGDKQRMITMDGTKEILTWLFWCWRRKTKQERPSALVPDASNINFTESIHKYIVQTRHVLLGIPMAALASWFIFCWMLMAWWGDCLCGLTGCQNCLTHWGWVTHICVSNLTIIGSDNGLSPGRCQAII